MLLLVSTPLVSMGKRLASCVCTGGWMWASRREWLLKHQDLFLIKILYNIAYLRQFLCPIANLVRSWARMVMLLPGRKTFRWTERNCIYIPRSLERSHLKHFTQTRDSITTSSSGTVSPGTDIFTNGLSVYCSGYLVFPSGLSPRYWPGPTLLSFWAMA